MKETLLLISNRDTFLVITIKKALSEAGFTVQSCVDSLDLIESFLGDTNIYLYYMDDASDINEELLVYLKEVSIDKSKKVIISCSHEQFKICTQILPESNLAASFIRPFDVHDIVKSLQTFSNDQTATQSAESILVVDDDVAYLKMINRWLKDVYKIYCVNSGMQAITWLAKNKCDLILLDYKMPIVSGAEVYRMLQSEPATKDIPVMFLTGKNDRNTISEVLSLKPQKYILKSIGHEELLATLANFFA